MNVSCAVYGEARVVVLQWLWDYMRAGLQEILLSPYLRASCAFLTHVILCAPFLALDALGSVCQRVRSWRIDAGSGPPPPLWRWYDCFWRVLYRYLTTVIPVTALFQAVRSPTLPEQAPTCWQLFVEVFACFLLFDTLFFLWHFSMHRWAVYTWLHLDSSVSQWCCTASLDFRFFSKCHCSGRGSFPFLKGTYNTTTFIQQLKLLHWYFKIHNELTYC